MNYPEPESPSPNATPPETTRLVTLCSCANAVEASVLCNRLLADGITAHVQGAEVATMLSYVGTAIESVRVEVSEEQLEQALQRLDQDREEANSRTDWSCNRCGEFNERTFDVCWSCNKTRDDGDPVAEETATTREAPPEPAVEFTHESTPDRRSSNPYHPPPTNLSAERVRLIERGTKGQPERGLSAGDEIERGEQTVQASDVLSRAWRASVLGVFLLPPMLHFYSVYLLLFRFPHSDRIPHGQRLKRVGLLCGDLLAVVIALFWWRNLMA